MRTGRLEAFSDGVLAIIITIMVLGLEVPRGVDVGALRSLVPALASYVLSFIYVGIYWNNHHHMLQVTERVNGAVLWANLHLLFWLSLIPVVTAWMGEHHTRSIPTAAYGVILLMAAIAYYILERTIIAAAGTGSALAAAIGDDWKGKLSPVLYATAIALAFVRPWMSEVLYASVALLWLVPDRRIERVMAERGGD